MISKDGGLQLLPQEHHRFRFINLPGSSGMLVFSVLFLIIASVGYFFTLYLTSKAEDRIVGIDSELKSIQEKRNLKTEEKILNFSQQIRSTQTLMGSHIVWSNVFLDIQHLVDQRVHFVSLEGDVAQARINVSAESDGFSSVARQIASFYSSSIVKDITIPNIRTINTGGVTFTMQLILNPEFFKKPIL